MKELGKYSYLLGKSAKINKSDENSEVDNLIMYLAPSNISGVDVCPNASNSCRKACLNTAGRGRFDNVQVARLNRTLHYLNDRVGFLHRLKKEIVQHYKRTNKKLAIRLNGTSDINWIPFIKKVHEEMPEIIFYDYTKNPRIALSALTLDYYNVTFSRSEVNEDICLDMLSKGVNVAAVFRKDLPTNYMGYPVIDGDVNGDVRYLDPKGVIVGLSAKGLAKKDKTGFVI